MRNDIMKQEPAASFRRFQTQLRYRSLLYTLGSRSSYGMIWYICWLELDWHAVAVVLYTFTHRQYIEQHS